MDDDDLAAYLLTPTATPVPAPVVPTTPARQLRDAVEPVATIERWSWEASQSALGLDFFSAYGWGRTAPADARKQGTG